MTGGGRINKPKSARCRTNLRKLKRNQLKMKKGVHARSEETLTATTEDILRQCRTNPKANVKLSGKKKRQLLKEAKRLVNERKEMEITAENGKLGTNTEQEEKHQGDNNSVTMDTS